MESGLFGGPLLALEQKRPDGVPDYDTRCNTL